MGTTAFSSDRFAPQRSFAQRARTWFQPQVSGGRREQRDQVLLLIAVAVVMLPHFSHMPLWSTIAISCVWIWRGWLTRSVGTGPGRPVTLSLLVLVTGAIWWEYGSLFARGASVNLLLLLTALKVLEMRARRDVMVIVFLCFFVLLTRFLDDESLASAVLMVVSVWLLFLVLLSVNLTEGDLSFAAKARFVSAVFLKALPLTLALFYFFPRLPAPMWSGGDADGGPSTGLSSSMSPGSIKGLLENDAIALRAAFSGVPPDTAVLYWRGPVFGRFDGRTWTRVPSSIEAQLTARRSFRIVPESLVSYTVTLEPTERNNLIALDLAWEIDGVPTVSSRLSPDLELRTAAPVTRRLRYEARSYTRYFVDAGLPDPSLAPWLELPRDYNPRTLAWAEELQRGLPRELSPGQREHLLIDKVLSTFRNVNFRYSLDPPTLGRDYIDEFLFDTRVGFCEHYASSFVFLARAMHIPARIVTGYQGGEPNPVDGFYTVRQSDAHAWAEAWIPGEGWVRVDPTQAVAPWRIERGSAFARPGGAFGERRTTWLHGWRLDREALENLWNQWFLSYSAERQRNLLHFIGIEPTLDRIAVVGAAVFCVLMAILGFFSLRQRAERDPLAELVQRVRLRLRAAGVEAPDSAGPRSMSERLAGSLEAASAGQGRAILEELEAARYARPSPRSEPLRLGRLRRRLLGWRAVPASNGHRRALFSRD